MSVYSILVYLRSFLFHLQSRKFICYILISIEIKSYLIQRSEFELLEKAHTLCLSCIYTTWDKPGCYRLNVYIPLPPCPNSYIETHKSSQAKLIFSAFPMPLDMN